MNIRKNRQRIILSLFPLKNNKYLNISNPDILIDIMCDILNFCTNESPPIFSYQHENHAYKILKKKTVFIKMHDEMIRSVLSNNIPFKYSTIYNIMSNIFKYIKIENIDIDIFSQKIKFKYEI